MKRTDPVYRSVREKILAAVKANPGRTQSYVLREAGLQIRGSPRKVVYALIAEGLLRIEPETKTYSRLYCVTEKRRA